MSDRNTSDIGNYIGLAKSELKKSGYPLSFLNNKKNIESWRKTARNKVFKLLSFEPKNIPLNAKVEKVLVDDGLVIEKISYALSYGSRVEGYFLYPEGMKGKLPAVIAFHDHSGYKYLGKEKIVKLPGEALELTKKKEKQYEGRGWANELAKRGFAVLVTDVFAFGSRKIELKDLPLWYRKDVIDSSDKKILFGGKCPGSPEYIAAYNRFAALHEHVLAKTLFEAGTTWPGVFSYEDRRSVDYLITRKEVDIKNIGCGGLSGGGLRTIYLGALEPRIKCGICIGMMSTIEEVLKEQTKCHTWMMHLPGLTRYLDLPDLAALRVPAPLMVQYDIHDALFTIKGQKDADRKLKAIYKKSGYAGNYSGKFYPGPHKFDLRMQEDAFRWFEKWLK